MPGMVMEDMDWAIEDMAGEDTTDQVDITAVDTATDIPIDTDMVITQARDLLMLNQKLKLKLTQAHGTDMEVTDIEATDMVDIMAVDIMVDTDIHTGTEDTTDTASKCHQTSITPPNKQHCRPIINQNSETFQ